MYACDRHESNSIQRYLMEKPFRYSYRLKKTINFLLFLTEEAQIEKFDWSVPGSNINDFRRHIINGFVPRWRFFFFLFFDTSHGSRKVSRKPLILRVPPPPEDKFDSPSRVFFNVISIPREFTVNVCQE